MSGTSALPAQWLRAATESQHLEMLWQQVVSSLAPLHPGLDAHLVHSTGGQWELLTAAEVALAPLAPLLANAADAEQAVVEWPFAAVPLRVRELPGLLLLLQWPHGPAAAERSESRPTEQIVQTLLALRTDLAAAIAAVWHRQQTVDRMRWLEEVLRSIEKWNQARVAAERVHAMERSAVQLLSCQHAFLMFSTGSDQRPAFARRSAPAPATIALSAVPLWHQDVRQGQVYRSVFPQAAEDLTAAGLRFEGEPPRSMMAVPVRGRRQDVVAALVLINKRSGGFSAADADKASELSQYMSTALHQQPTDAPLGEFPQAATERHVAPARLIGESEVILDLRQSIQRIAPTELPVLVTGENGTGKEVISRMIHTHSPRADRPFLAVNCAAISESLLESELFGHEKGAFTDAHRTRAGKFELAHGGTLFLDEIGDMSMAGQVKLLRVLEEKVITRVGGSESIDADVRVLAATNRDLGQLVREHRFREDLFFRLNVVTLRLPPLRARHRDILLLARHFLEEFSQRVERPTPVLSPEAQRRLLHYPWPGNVRELRNLMERIVFLTTEETVDEQILATVLPDQSAKADSAMELTLSEATRQFQIDFITHHIASSRGNMSEAARRLGLHRSNLYRKLAQLGLAEPES